MARLDFVVYGKAYSGMRAEPDFVIALAGTNQHLAKDASVLA